MAAAARLVAYLVAIVASSALIGRLLIVRTRLARALVAVMVAWLLNSIILLSYLLWLLATGDETLPWREWTQTIDALLLAAAPVLLYWFLSREER